MVAGFCGACLRFACQSLPFPYLGGFPLATLLINVVGSFFIFLVFEHAGRRWHLTPQVISVINTGFLGAFTTLAALCTDTITMLGNQQYVMVALYLGLTFVLSFGAVLLANWACGGLAFLRMKRLEKLRKERNEVRHKRGGGK